MSFLDFFKQKPQGPRINVRVWMNQAAKEKACTRMAKEETTLIFIAWSKVTCNHFEDVFRREYVPNGVMTAKDILPSRIAGRKFVFLERHYDLDKEKKFIESLNADDVLVHVSLSDPLMSAFNPERIQNLLEDMGHKDDEFIEHEMVNKSIERAMEKIKNSDLQGGGPEDLIEWMDGIV